MNRTDLLTTAIILVGLTAVSCLPVPVNGNSYETPRTATYTIAAYDAPPHVKAQADFVCDGLNDNEEIQMAIDSLPKGATGGGKIHLSVGHFRIYKTIRVNQDNIAIEGENWGASIVDVCAPMENSFYVSGNYSNFRDLKVDGQFLAQQFHIQAGSLDFRRVSINKHTVYNALADYGEGAITFDQCRFYGMPVKGTLNNITIRESRFYADGLSPNLLISGRRILLEGNRFMQFADASIKIIGQTNGLAIQNNYFETSSYATNVIDAWSGAYGLWGSTITGNTQSNQLNVTNFIKVYGLLETTIENNFIGKPIVIGGAGHSFRVRSLDGYIHYNGRTNLTYVEKYYGANTTAVYPP